MTGLGLSRPAAPWRPPSGKNNLWYEYRPNAEGVVVFVHGFLSESETCWWNEDTRTYWPALLRDSFPGYSVFLGGYKTGVFSKDYRLGHCSNELWDALRLSHEGRKAVLDHGRIIFLVHSLGGIVVRNLIVTHQLRLQRQSLGLLLMASPSLGSGYASILSGLAELLSNEVGSMLQANTPLLVNLDDQFKGAIADLANLHGHECAEDVGLTPGTPPIVPEESAFRYFPSRQRRLPGTNHATIVKPDGTGHPAAEQWQLFHEAFQEHCAARQQLDQAIAAAASSTQANTFYFQDISRVDAIDLGPEPPNRTFIGREPELNRLARHLLSENPQTVAVCSVHGLPGIGKSYLCDHFAHLHRDHFPGGYLRLTLDPATPLTAPSLLAQLHDRLRLPAAPPDQHAQLIRERLLTPRTLVHLENIDSDELAAAAGHALAQLPGCPILLSGRLQDLGRSQGWQSVALDLLPLEDALTLLLQESGIPAEHPGLADFVLRQLGRLPLAIHLAAAHLRAGVPLARLQSILDLTLRDAADPRRQDPRFRLRSSLALSVEILLQSWPAAERPEIRRALFAFGAAPLCGVGPSLGAAICGLEEDAYLTLLTEACRLSLALPVEGRNQQGAFRVHPLVRQFLRGEEEPAAVERRDQWFLQRLPKAASSDEAAGQKQRWDEIEAERAALELWLSEAEPAAIAAATEVGHLFANSHGPYAAWSGACLRALAELPTPPASVPWVLVDVLIKSGQPEQATEAARQMHRQQLAQDNQREAAMALGQIADIFQARGQYDEALRLRREEELPVYEKLGDIRERAVTLGKIADIFQARGQYDEALRLRREEALPVYEKLGDIRSRAVTLGQIADIFQARGDYDEALRLRREEELPVYEKLGDIRSRAVTLGQIADIFEARGDYDEALRLRREEELPVYEKLGDIRSRAVTLGQIADIFQARGQYDEALRLRREEELPVYEKLGDIRSRAVTLGKIAIILFQQGNPDEAIRQFEAEALPSLEEQGDAQLIATGSFLLAQMYVARNRPEDRPRARQLLQRAAEIATRLGLQPWLAPIRDLQRRLG